MKEAGLFILGTRESLNTGSEMLAGQVEQAGHFWGVGGGSPFSETHRWCFLFVKNFFVLLFHEVL